MTAHFPCEVDSQAFVLCHMDGHGLSLPEEKCDDEVSNHAELASTSVT